MRFCRSISAWVGAGTADEWPCAAATVAGTSCAQVGAIIIRTERKKAAVLARIPETLEEMLAEL